MCTAIFQKWEYIKNKKKQPKISNKPCSDDNPGHDPRSLIHDQDPITQSHT